MFIAHAAWLIVASESIRHVDPNAYVSQALDYVGRHADTKFRVSESSSCERPSSAPRATSERRDRPRSNPSGILLQCRGPRPFAGWRVNDPWLTKAVFGPREVDSNSVLELAGDRSPARHAARQGEGHWSASGPMKTRQFIAKNGAIVRCDASSGAQPNAILAGGARLGRNYLAIGS